MDSRIVLDQLALAHALLAAGRSSFQFARDSGGISVWVGDPKAVQFCIVGAMLRAAFELNCDSVPLEFMVEDVHAELYPDIFSPIGVPLTHWHDNVATTAEALALLEECAARINPK